VAEDVLRDFEARWWGTARKGDADTMAEMLAGGREVLATTIDENGRTCVSACAWLLSADARSSLQSAALCMRRRL